MAIATSDRPERWDVQFDPDMTPGKVDEILSIEPFCNIDREKFPKKMPLEGILLNDCRVLDLKKGDVVVSEGDYGNTAFFIIEGQIDVIIAQKGFKTVKKQKQVKKNFISAFFQFIKFPKASEYRSRVKGSDDDVKLDKNSGRLFLQDVDQVIERGGVGRISSGEFFGEIAALGRTPRTATIVASSKKCVLLEIKWQGLRELRKFTPSIREHIDKIYRERSLNTFLKEVGIFKALSDDELQQVADATQFMSYGSFDWHTSYKKLLKQEADASSRLDVEPVICEEGNFPSDLVMVRTGFSRVSEKSGNGHRTISYLGKGQLFGLEELIHNWENEPENHLGLQYTMRGIGHTDVLVVPGYILEKFVFPKLRPDQKPKFFQMDKSISEAKKLKLKDKLRKTKIPTSQLEFFVENRIINGTASMLINLNQCTRCDDCVVACATTHDDNPRFVREGNVIENILVANACMHCQDPVCMIGCPTGAITRQKAGGQVAIEDLTCVGCATCANSCPYENIKMVEVRQKSGPFIVDDATNQPILKATKCDLCFEQWAGPSCQNACPHDALVRVDMRDTAKLAWWGNR